MNEPEPGPGGADGDPDGGAADPERGERLGGGPMEPEPIQLDKGCAAAPGSAPMGAAAHAAIRTSSTGSA